MYILLTSMDLVVTMADGVVADYVKSSDERHATDESIDLTGLTDGVSLYNSREVPESQKE